MNDIQLIDLAQFRDHQKTGDSCFVDVRNRDEFNRGSEARVCWPVGEIDGVSASEFVRQHKLAPDQTVVLLCASGKRAQLAAGKLRTLIPNPIAVVQGGYAALSATTGKSRLSIERQVRIAAGLLVVLGSLTALMTGPIAIVFCLLVGCGLIFAGITDWCGMGLLLMKMPWNKG